MRFQNLSLFAFQAHRDEKDLPKNSPKLAKRVYASWLYCSNGLLIVSDLIWLNMC